MVLTTSSSKYNDDYDDDYSTVGTINAFKDDKQDEAAAKPASPEFVRSKVPSPIKSSTDSPVSTPKVRTGTKTYASKTIDLGAAADYAKQQEISPEKPTASNSKITTQPNMLFDLIENTENLDSKQTASSSNVTDLFDSLTIQPSTTQFSSDDFGNFADFSKFNEDQQPKSTVETKATAGDDDFADFASAFSSLPAQLNPQPASQTTQLNKSASGSAQDDLLGLDISSSISPIAATNISSSNLDSLTGLSSDLFATNSNLSNVTKPQTTFQSDFLTPLTPSKVTSKSQSFDLFKKEEPKASPTASTIINTDNTWKGLTQNLNIDLDNLLQSKKEKPKPSMNQLAANRTVNQSFVQSGEFCFSIK